MAFLGVYLVAAAVLVIAGAAKAARPGPAADTVTRLAPFTPRRLAVGLVRAVAGAEVALGVAACVVPGHAPALGVGASYVVFAATAAVIRAHAASLASCGCFGAPDTPVGAVHVVVNLALAAGAGWYAAASPHGAVWRVLSTQPGAGAPLVLAAGAATGCALLLLTGLARLAAARRALGGERRERCRRPGGVVPRSAPVPAQRHRALGVRRQRRRRRGARLRAASGVRLRRHLQLRQRRLRLRVHLLRGVQRLLLHGERRVTTTARATR